MSEEHDQTNWKHGKGSSAEPDAAQEAMGRNEAGKAGGKPEVEGKGGKGARQKAKPDRKAVKRSSGKKGASKKAKSQSSRKAKDGVTKVAEGAKASGAGSGEAERDASGRFARSQAEPVAAKPRKTATDSDPKNQGNGNGRGTGVNLMTEAGQKKLVNKLLSKADALAEKEAFKLNAADLIRLIQLQKDLTAKPPHKVTVQWVEDEGE